jgi:N-methylhydantoinase A/oxoprolinase/acetone carboxylase beta subunit
MSGLEKLARMAGMSLSDFLGRCDAIVHATTVADNTLIEMNGALTGLITTEGFRDEIEYRRGFKEDIWDVRLAPNGFWPMAPCTSRSMKRRCVSAAGDCGNRTWSLLRSP